MVIIICFVIMRQKKELYHFETEDRAVTLSVPVNQEMVWLIRTMDLLHAIYTFFKKQDLCNILMNAKVQLE